MAFIADNFDRANGSLGTSSSGHVWVASDGTINVASNKAVCGTIGTYSAMAAFDVGVTNHWIQARATAPGTVQYTPAFVARFTDIDNFYLMEFGPVGCSLNKIVGGTFGSLNKDYTGITDGDVVRFEIQGNALRFYINGVLTMGYIDNDLPSGTKLGIRFGENSGTLDDVTTGGFPRTDHSAFMTFF